MDQLLDHILSLREKPMNGAEGQFGTEDVVNRSDLSVLLMRQGDDLWDTEKLQALERYIQAIKIAQIDETWEIESALYFKLGERLLEEKHYGELAELGEIAASRAQCVGDWDQVAEFVQWAVMAFFKENKRLEMIAPLKELVESLDKVKNLELALKVLDTYIFICIMASMFAEAINYSDKYISLARQLNDHKREIEIFTHLVTCYIALGQHENAKEAAENGLRIAWLHYMPEVTVKSLILLSNAEIALGNHEAALINENEALEIARTIQNEDIELECLAENAQIRNSLGLSYEGVQIAAEGLKLSIQREKHSFIIKFLALLKNNGEMTDIVWDEFKQLGDKALLAIRAGDNSLQLTECLSNLGDLNLERNPKISLEYYRELEKYYDEEGNVAMKVGLYRSIAQAYQNLGLYVDAAISLEQALLLFYRNKLSNRWQYLMILLELSTVYYQNGDFLESKRLINRIDSLFEDKNPEDMSWAFGYRFSEQKGNLYLAKKEYRQAELAFEKALLLLNTRFFLAVSPDIRLSIQNAVRKISNRLLISCLSRSTKSKNDSSKSKRAFQYVELSRSRLFLAQLGQTSILAPSTAPKFLLKNEQSCMNKLKTYNVRFQNPLEASYVSSQMATWNELQQIWREIEVLDVASEQYVALRRGDVADYNMLREVLIMR
jgi:tetratricopeptide (TPR) repeat protein